MIALHKNVANCQNTLDSAHTEVDLYGVNVMKAVIFAYMW